MDAIRKVVPEDQPEILESDDKCVDWFETDLHRKIEACTTHDDVMRIYRKNHGWTQAELDEKLGSVSRQNVSHTEQRRRPINISDSSINSEDKNSRYRNKSVKDSLTPF